MINQTSHQYCIEEYGNIYSHTGLDTTFLKKDNERVNAWRYKSHYQQVNDKLEIGVYWTEMFQLSRPAFPPDHRLDKYLDALLR